jgi:hypothetical protein
MSKKIYGHKVKHYPRPYREFIDMDYCHKLTNTDLAYRSRFEANRTGGRFLYDGFDVEGNDDDARKGYMVDGNHIRSDISTAIKCGTPSLDIDGQQYNPDRFGVVERNRGTPGASSSGYVDGGRNLEEDRMIAYLDGDLDEEDYG